jgi:hypothetical protein
MTTIGFPVRRGPTGAESVRTRTNGGARALASQLRAISWVALLMMVPVVFYFTTQGTWDLTEQTRDGGWSSGFFMAQAESMLVHGRLDVAPEEIRSECFERDSRCYGYFGVTPSLLRIPFLGILRYLHSALTPLYLGIAVLLGYWAALQMLQRSLRDSIDSARPGAPALAYTIVGALALGPGGTLMFVTRPAVYEEAIAWGVAFVLLAVNHVWSWYSREARSLVPAVLFAVGAANARPTAAIVCGVLGLVVAASWYFGHPRATIEDPATAPSGNSYQALRSSRSKGRVLVAAACLSLLPGLTAGGVFWLKLRTPIPDLRLNEQVPEMPWWRAILEKNGGKTTGLVFTPTELVAYFRPDAVTRRPEWPFFDFRFPAEPILWMPPLPEGGAYVERFTSVTATMPLPWIVTLMVAIWLGIEGWRLAAIGRRAASPPAPLLTREQWLLAVGLLASVAAMAALTVTTVGITNRYLADFFATSVVGVALGHRVILRFCNQRPIIGAVAGLIALLLTGWSIVVTLSLSTRLVFG